MLFGDGFVACQAELPTLMSSCTSACIKESYNLKQKEILLNAAKSILSLSANLEWKEYISYLCMHVDGIEINRCSGLVLELDGTKNSAIILTSAWLICTNKPFDEWSDKKYAPEAKVTIHLLDGITVDGELLYFSKHYDIAFYEILVRSHLQTLPLELDPEYGEDLFVLARDKNMDFICKTVQMMYVDPCEYQHNHYMFIGGSIPKCGTGGTLVNLNGKIMGMLFDTLPLAAFIPSSLIIRCLGLLRQYGRVVRPQLGLKLATVGLLDMAHIELLSRRYGVTSGLIVGEVSAGCFAERVGIRRGDVILSCQGVRISSVAQLEEILLDIGEKHIGKGNGVGSEANVEVKP
ncbi:hypothetical protein PR202_gb11260 [Eleusine coracana subsp. coracana]|uniref:PDZ domain-containing protein n=1 Tax=Eleusine coracana subsp. coracana TaxID=191504 RepID=A0AAV5EMZ4_ELECO|nr:hypothetical protein PR202_gb11260 [Eleusine coracana subsp. coracana]